MNWDADNLTLQITERRLNKLKGCINQLLEMQSFSVRSLSSFVGQVISLGPGDFEDFILFIYDLTSFSVTAIFLIFRSREIL